MSELEAAKSMGFLYPKPVRKPDADSHARSGPKTGTKPAEKRPESCLDLAGAQGNPWGGTQQECTPNFKLHMYENPREYAGKNDIGNGVLKPIQRTLKNGPKCAETACIAGLYTKIPDCRSPGKSHKEHVGRVSPAHVRNEPKLKAERG